MPDRSRHDVNLVPTLAVVSNTDGETPVSLWANPATHELLIGIEALDTGSRWYFSNKEDTGTYAYYGFEDKNGNWQIKRKTIASDVWLFAGGASDYSTAWTDRASQTYASAGTTFN